MFAALVACCLAASRPPQLPYGGLRLSRPTAAVWRRERGAPPRGGGCGCRTPLVLGRPRPRQRASITEELTEPPPPMPRLPPAEAMGLHSWRLSRGYLWTNVPVLVGGSMPLPPQFGTCRSRGSTAASSRKAPRRGSSTQTVSPQSPPVCPKELALACRRRALAPTSDIAHPHRR